MASAVYPKFREQLMAWAFAGGVPAALTLRAIGVDSGYTYDAAHTDLTNVDPGAITVAELTLDNVTYVDGLIDADDELIEGVTAGESLNALILYLSNDVDSYLVAFIDETSDGSIPQTFPSTTGVIRWNPTGICRI